MKGSAFTLVEVLVVVILLGILAAVVVPQFSTATANARASMLRDDLRIMRMQIAVFTEQHLGIPPGFPLGKIEDGASEQVFIDHMTLASNMYCQLADLGTEGYPYGPYMREMMTNPINDMATIRIIAANEPLPTVAAGTHGWIYCPSRPAFFSDAVGCDDTGVSYIEY